MSVKKNKIRMSFICNQNWEEMSPSSKGRYCEFCKQEVSDFTRYSDKEIDLLGKSNNNLCGRFTIEQVDNDLIIPIELSKPVKIFGFLSVLFLSMHSGKSFGQNVNDNYSKKIERVDNINDYDSVSSHCNTISASNKNSNKANHKKLVLTTKRKRIYLTRRFPFIKAVRAFHVMGKFRI